MKNIPWDKVVSVCSWVIVLALAYGAIAVWVYTVPLAGGPVTKALGIFGAQIFYSALYGLEALFLGFAKLTKRNRLRTNTLLVIYLTGFFTSILFSILAGGFMLGIIDNLILASLAAVCWLYWTIKLKYHS